MGMVDIVAQQSTLPVRLNDVAERQNLSLNYLEQVFMKLKKANLVKSVKGPGGGYIVENPSKIYLSDLISAADEEVKITRCGVTKLDGCVADKGKCSTHDLWEGLSKHIMSYFASITLSDVCERKINVNRDIAFIKNDRKENDI